MTDVLTDRQSEQWLRRLPHAEPMRLVQRVLDVRPGEHARCARQTEPGDWYFQGHFPGTPVIPAIVLVELLAQTGGLAAASHTGTGAATHAGSDAAAPTSGPTGGPTSGPDAPAPLAMRVAAFGAFKFPRGAGPGVTLEATARVAGRMGGLYKIEGEVTADGALVAIGSLTLAEAPAASTTDA